MVFQFPSGHHLSAVVGEGTSHSQLVQQLVDQHAGLPAALQHQRRAAHGAEVALQQEAGEALLAVGVSAGRVQRPDEGLQADLTDQVVVHLVLVQVLVVLLQLVAVAAQGAHVGRRGQQSVIRRRQGWGGCFGHRRGDFGL